MNSLIKKSKDIFISTFILVFLFMFFSGKVEAQNYSTLCNNGMILEKNGDINSAINKYSDAISIKPGNWKAYTYRAKAYYAIGNYEKALSDISQAITISPTDISFYEVRANCYLAKEDYEKALADFNLVISKANKNDIKYFQTYFNRGKTLYYIKRYDDAVSDFTQAIYLGKKDPKNVTNSYNYLYIYSWRGISYMEANKYSEAVDDFNTHLAAYPNYIQSVFYQGLCYYKTGDKEKAKTNALKLIDIDPSKEVYFSGDHLLEIYDLDARRKIVKQSLSDAKTAINGYNTSSSTTIGNIKLVEAFAKLDKAWLHSNGIKKEDRELNDTILKLFFKIYPLMQEKPELPELARKYMVQAKTATEEKNYNEAISLWNKAIGVAPYYPLSYFNRALLKEIQNDYRGASDDVKKYLELSPDAQNARDAQDKIYEWEGKIKKTSTTYTTSTGGVMQNKPVNSSANNNAKAKFILKGGLNMPKGVFKTTPGNIKDSAFLKSGNLGAQTGFFIEAAVGINFSKESSVVQFYYNPFVFSCSSNKMSWGGASLKTSDTNRNIRSFEIAQRYGIGFRIAPKLLLAFFYRPGVIFPLNLKYSYKINSLDTTTYKVYGTMSDKTVFMMSHTFGTTLTYSFVSLSFEMYFAHPTYDVDVNQYNDANSTKVSGYTVPGVKIPMRTNRISIAFNF